MVGESKGESSGSPFLFARVESGRDVRCRTVGVVRVRSIGVCGLKRELRESAAIKRVSRFFWTLRRDWSRACDIPFVHA